MNIVYNVEISVTVKTDKKDNPHYWKVIISLPDTTYERFSSIWPEVLDQAEGAKKLLERELRANHG